MREFILRLRKRSPFSFITSANHSSKVSLLPLVFFIFYEVSAGPFGVEDTVQAAGPLLALLGFLLFPLIWSVPEALITAEMGTMFPENGGYVVPIGGFSKSAVPVVGGGLPRVTATWTLTIVLTYLNYRGMVIVGWVAVCLGVFSLLPFVVMGFLSIPDLQPSRWVVTNLNDVSVRFPSTVIFGRMATSEKSKKTRSTEQSQKAKQPIQKCQVLRLHDLQHRGGEEAKPQSLKWRRQRRYVPPVYKMTDIHGDATASLEKLEGWPLGFPPATSPHHCANSTKAKIQNLCQFSLPAPRLRPQEGSALAFVNDADDYRLIVYSENILRKNDSPHQPPIWRDLKAGVYPFSPPLVRTRNRCHQRGWPSPPLSEILLFEGEVRLGQAERVVVDAGVGGDGGVPLEEHARVTHALKHGTTPLELKNPRSTEVKDLFFTLFLEGNVKWVESCFMVGLRRRRTKWKDETRP
ncbi:hypothetical protein V8G54_032173 [Vigna mungo]|uniref:Uncharacterized protein n=1 Tax=Vigna mungo TaxID=3915 RepID=A0AAQ3RIK5_VIGMU